MSDTVTFTSEHDHFANVASEPGHSDSELESGFLEYSDVLAEEPPKRKIPLWMLIIGVFALALAGSAVYSLVIAPKKTPIISSTSSPGSQLFNTPTQPRASGQPVSMPLPAPLPTAAVQPGQVTNTAPLPADLSATAASESAPAAGLPNTTTAPAQNASTEISSEPGQSTPSPVGNSLSPSVLAEIRTGMAKTDDRVNDISARLGVIESKLEHWTPASATGSNNQAGQQKASHQHPRFVRHGSNGSLTATHATGDEKSNSVLADLHLKQVVEGQAWIYNDATGQLTTVGVGDSVAGLTVKKIDANAYTVLTSAGLLK